MRSCLLRNQREQEPVVERENFTRRQEQGGETDDKIDREKQADATAGALVFACRRFHDAPLYETFAYLPRIRI